MQRSDVPWSTAAAGKRKCSPMCIGVDAADRLKGIDMEGTRISLFPLTDIGDGVDYGLYLLWLRDLDWRRARM